MDQLISMGLVWSPINEHRIEIIQQWTNIIWMKMNVINDNQNIEEVDNMENGMYMDEISQHAWQYMDKNDHHSYWFTCLSTYVRPVYLVCIPPLTHLLPSLPSKGNLPKTHENFVEWHWDSPNVSWVSVITFTQFAFCESAWNSHSIVFVAWHYNHLILCLLNHITFTQLCVLWNKHYYTHPIPCLNFVSL